MKIEIDTTQDSPEIIQAAIQMLQAHLKNKGQYKEEKTYGTQSYNSYSHEDRLARKIERAKAKQEVQEETSVPMNMFDTPITSESNNKEPDEPEEKIEILRY